MSGKPGQALALAALLTLGYPLPLRAACTKPDKMRVMYFPAI